MIWVMPFNVLSDLDPITCYLSLLREDKICIQSIALSMIRGGGYRAAFAVIPLFFWSPALNLQDLGGGEGSLADNSL
jgi:hypothetical protein